LAIAQFDVVEHESTIDGDPDQAGRQPKIMLGDKAVDKLSSRHGRHVNGLDIKTSTLPEHGKVLNG